MENNNKERNAQSFGKKLVRVLGEKHLQIKEAKFITIIFCIVVVLTLIFFTGVKRKIGY